MNIELDDIQKNTPFLNLYDTPQPGNLERKTENDHLNKSAYSLDNFLYQYRLDMPSLKRLHSYLTKRRQRVKINDTYSSWSEILFGVRQGSILGPFLFNIFLCDLFLFVLDIGIANYADNNTSHTTNKHLETVLKDLEQGSDTLLKWFTDNLLKANPEKYHLLVSTNEKRHLNVGKVEVSNSKCEKFLGIKIDSKLMFDSHVKSLCKKASQKLNFLKKITLITFMTETSKTGNRSFQGKNEFRSRNNERGT